MIYEIFIFIIVLSDPDKCQLLQAPTLPTPPQATNPPATDQAIGSSRAPPTTTKQERLPEQRGRPVEANLSKLAAQRTALLRRQWLRIYSAALQRAMEDIVFHARPHEKMYFSYLTQYINDVLNTMFTKLGLALDIINESIQQEEKNRYKSWDKLISTLL